MNYLPQSIISNLKVGWILNGGLALCTLCLHPGADQSQGVAGQLATGARDGTAAQQHQNTWVGGVFGVAGQPDVLQTLVRIRVCVIRTKLITALVLYIYKLFIYMYLVHCQIYPSVGNDAQNIGNVALIKGPHSLLLQDFLGTVEHSWVLSGFPQGQPGFHHLNGQRSSIREAVLHRTALLLTLIGL